MKHALTAAALVAVSLAAFAVPAKAVIFQTATFGDTSGGSYGFYGDGTDAGSNFIGASFHVGTGGFDMEGVIANFDGNANIVPGSGVQSIFVAIVPVSEQPGQGLVPAVTPANLAAAAIAHLVFAAPTTAGDKFLPLHLILPAGDYAAVFGAGLFGASTAGSEGLLDSNTTIGTPNIFNTLAGDGTWTPYGFDTQIRIAEVPEPASMTVLGLGFAALVSARRRRIA